MAFALLLATAAAAAGFVVSSVFGFILAAHGPHDPLIRMLVSRHVLYSIPAVLLSLFSQSMVIFYFIGTCRLVKDEIASYSSERQNPVLKTRQRFEAEDMPAAAIFEP